MKKHSKKLHPVVDYFRMLDLFVLQECSEQLAMPDDCYIDQKEANILLYLLNNTCVLCCMQILWFNLVSEELMLIW